MQNIFNSSQWLTTPKAYWTIQYEYQRSGLDMQYRFYWKVWLGSSSNYYYDGLKLKLFLNGIPWDETVKPYKEEKGWSYDGTTGWFTVYNVTAGTVPFYAQLYDTTASTTKVTSSTHQLYVVPSKAIVTSAQNFNDEGNPTVSFTNGGNYQLVPYLNFYIDGTWVHRIERSKGSYSSPYTWSLTEAERKDLRVLLKKANSCVVYEGFDSYNGATSMGYDSLEKTFSIVNATPVFTASQITYADTNTEVTDVTSNPLQIVQNQSTLAVTVTSATPKKEAEISKYEITVNGVTKIISTSATVSFGKINSATNCEIVVKVTDSRGNTTTAKKTVEVLAWTPPVFTASLERLNNYEDETHLTVNASISSLDEKNTTTISYRYKESGGEYGAETETENKTLNILNLDKNKAYVFSITVADAFDSATNEFALSKGKFPLFIDTEKSAVGINEFPSTDEALRVAGGIAHFEDGVKIGGIELDHIVEQGTTGYWTYCKRQNGVAECYGQHPFSAIKITKAWGSIFEAEYPLNAYFPSGLFVEAPTLSLCIHSSSSGILSIETMGETTKDVTCNFYPTRVTALTVDKIVVSIRAVGRWK